MPAERSPAPPTFFFFAVFVVGISGLLFGYNMTVISGAILFLKDQFNLSPILEETIVSAPLLGGLFGAAASGPLTDRFGRRVIMLLSATAFTLGALAGALAPDVAIVIVARFVAGTALGMVSVLAPLYLSEIAPDHLRGRMVGVFMVLSMVGALIAFLVDYAFAADQGWRAMFGIPIGAAVIFGIGVWILPDSPRWLVNKGRSDLARQALARFRGSANVDDELRCIEESRQAGGATWAALLAPAIRRAVIVGVGLGFFQRVTGIDAAFFYAPTIFKQAGFDNVSLGILAGAGVGAALLIGQLVGMAFVDRAGRRPLLLIGVFGAALCMASLGIAFMMPGGSVVAQWLAIAGVILFAGFWAVGPATVTFLMISELFPLSVRGLGMSVATVALWGTFLIVSVSFLTLTELIGQSGVFWSNAVLGLLACVFVFCLVPETKGKSLEEIEASWRRD